MRDFKQEHNRRQQSKKRIAFEVDRQAWESLKELEQKAIKRCIVQILETEVGRS